jgi:hypothetical protein
MHSNSELDFLPIIVLHGSSKTAMMMVVVVVLMLMMLPVAVPARLLSHASPCLEHGIRSSFFSEKLSNPIPASCDE